MTGWMAERFAREERLQGLTHYLEEFLGPGTDPALAQAMAEAELSRMALQWGLEVEDIEDGGLAD